MSTRRTRAASRREYSPEHTQEAPVARQTRSGSKRTGPPSDASPQAKTVCPRIPQRGTRRRRRRRSMESVATNDFPKSSAEHASPEPPVMEEDPEPLQVEHVPSSDIESQDDAYERLQDLLDFDLPKLSRWCDRVFAVLASLDLSEATIEQRKELKMARRRFKSARHSLIDDTTVYIDEPLSILPQQVDPYTYEKVQKSTRRANLISLLLSLYDVERSKQDASHFIRGVDDNFTLFLDPYSPTQPEGYSLALRVRCRRLVEAVREERKIEPLVVATTLFCEHPASTSEEAAQRLRQGPFRKLGQEGQDGGFTTSSSFKEQMDELVSKLSLPTNAEIEKSLDATYPSEELFRELRSWTSHMYSSFVQQVQETDPPPTSQKGGQPNNENQMDEHEGLFVSDGHEQDHGSVSDSSSEHEEYHQLKTLTKEPSFIKGPGALAAVRRRESSISKKARIEPPSRERPAKGKLTESQMIHAVRQLDPAEVLGDWGDDDDDVVPKGTRAADPRSRSSSQDLGATTKRTRPEEDEDYADEGDDFEVNEQVLNENRRYRYDDPEASRPVSKRSRFAVDKGRNGDGPQSVNGTPADNMITVHDLNILSKAARANKLAHKGKAPQLRERWSTADTNRLLDLIAEPSINCSWAEIERQGNRNEKRNDGFETYRNQQAIRDKARNLKKGYLCADAILPGGFDLVYLSKKEKDDVIASGHNPDRMEDDIDERGRVTRNLWKDRGT
ncbi:hypothetical protein F5Y08DRAFT_274562 [Xylaria arbuscula]|nr:hypothetical protein F5Y08DRAFT_274562 [Xylaria arbuscula]